MNKKQWYVLAIVSFLFGMFFIRLDLNNGFLYSLPNNLTKTGNVCLDMTFTDLDIKQNLLDKHDKGEITWKELEEGFKEVETLDEYDIICLLGGEIYEPFIYLFNFLWPVFLILAWLEPKKHQD